MDRITVVETKYLLKPQKINIANDYLLSDILKDVGLKNGDVMFDENVIDNIVSNYTREGGVRKLKSLLYSIVRELNIANLLKTRINNKKVKFPFTIENDDLKILLKEHRTIEYEKIHKEDMLGVMNGLWANSYGNGGILEIQSLWIPTATPFEIRATGNLQQVIKESTMVASSLAFNYLDKELQNKYLIEWKKKPQGIHLHFPDGATPKDGPSAGGALAVTIYSLLSKRKIKHDVAMTGEINFQGRITAIGGLENKLEGAKRAGVKLALYPKENQKDMDKIYERNPSLIDESFTVIAIDSLEEAIKYTII
jgi:ATP-dependent Lon protease